MSDSLPFYVPSAAELEIVEGAYAERLPVMLTGPTGCGKTRFVEYLAAGLGRPLVTVTCHDDLTTADLVGRYLVQGGDVHWIDGPLTRAVRESAICYLDEVIEARRDTLAVLHSLCDHRRALYLERTGETLTATADFMLVCSYNPRSRGAFKELKASFRQRFVTVGIDYLPPTEEARVVATEARVSVELATSLVAQATAMREAAEQAMSEPPSTRVIIATAALIRRGVASADALQAGLLSPLAADAPIEQAIRELLHAAGGD